jgi:hypothetical protein
MVSGAEHGQEVAGGFLLGDVLNIDHHAPSPRMDRPVSSATLAIAHLRAAGLPHGTIVLNHTDCDSILSAGIASGRLAPEDRFSEAAIAADHTGADNEIADLLQALDGRRDLRLSFRSLDRLLRGESLEKTAEDGLAERRRQTAAGVVRRGGWQRSLARRRGPRTRADGRAAPPVILVNANLLLYATVCRPSPGPLR